MVVFYELGPHLSHAKHELSKHSNFPVSITYFENLRNKYFPMAIRCIEVGVMGCYFGSLYSRCDSQSRGSLSRVVAHKNLWVRLRPLAEDAHNEILTGSEALSKANQGAKGWLKKGKAERMEGFEEQVNLRCSTVRLAALTLNG